MNYSHQPRSRNHPAAAAVVAGDRADGSSNHRSVPVVIAEIIVVRRDNAGTAHHLTV
jgi:hypothetical protein